MKLGIYLTLGDFGMEASVAILKAASQAGASLLEVGLPFSDPLLDGPVIQKSHERALQAKNLQLEDLAAGLKSLVELRPQTQISVMTSYQLLYQEERNRSFPPVDGTLITDLAWNEPANIALPGPRVWFLSQDVVLGKAFSAPPEKISMVYLTRVQGITGAQQKDQSTTQEAVSLIKKHTDKPVWLGFGISNRKDLEDAHSKGADGGIIGSAFVSMLEKEFGRLNSTNSSASVQATVLAAAAGEWVTQLLR